MASVLESGSRPLSLHVDTPPSASPFPSPSSSFLPPPMPGAHEFAVKPPPRRRSTANSPATTTPDSPTKRVSAPSPVAQSPTTNGHASTTTVSPTITEQPAIPKLDTEIEQVVSPTTPTPTASSMHHLHHHRQFSDSLLTAGTVDTPTQSDHSSLPQSHSQSQQPFSSTLSSSEKHKSIGSYYPQPTPPHHHHHYTSLSLSLSSSPSPIPISSSQPPPGGGLTRSASLSSQRPAPPSPAGSRRISTISSTSKPTSASVSRSNSQRHSRALSMGGMGVSSPGSKRQSSQLGPGGGFAGVKEKDESNTGTGVAPGAMKLRKRSTKVKIKIRDFAFIISDDRYRGMGVDVPKPNRFARLNKKLGGSKKTRPTSKRWSVSSSTPGTPSRLHGGGGSDDEGGGSDDDNEGENDDDDDDEESEGWFRRGMGRFSWSFGFGGLKRSSQQQNQNRSSKDVEEQEEEESYPSRGDMERNFLEEEDHEHDHDEMSGQSGRSSDVFFDAEEGHDIDSQPQSSTQSKSHPSASASASDEEADEEEDEPLFPGLYRAMFAFEPEGTAEMRLTEDQIIRVVGRGGGVGWAVVVVPEGVEGGVEVEEETGLRHALVPESYLEPVELD